MLDREVDAAAGRFVAALATQCFLNEYVFEVAEDEAASVATLKQAIESAAGDDGFPDAADCQNLLRYALYAPLSSLDSAGAIAANPLEGWPQGMRPIAAAQLRDWRTERDIASALPAIGTVSDTVSQAVAAQYEDNPYPRWSAAPPSWRRLRAPLQVFARQFPRQQVPDSRWTGGLDVLVAGCGTGRHPISVGGAQRYEDCQVLAVDLSRASLAYAASERPREMGVGRISNSRRPTFSSSARLSDGFT